ncbi:MAG: Fis family transcriptional regulator, partial [Methanomicrobiales archaeon]|nr:Fis family transcriptional regulator [Methanomicrobiales archaeon]
GIAILNALSESCWKRRPDYVRETGRDILDTVPLPGDGYVAVVGALVPVIRRLKARGKPFGILELDPRTLKPDELPYAVPRDEADAAVQRADMLVITGTTLINNTLEPLLALARPGASIVVVGPTASMLPDAFFRRGVTMLGGDSVTRPDEVLDTIAEGGSGYHFFGKSAEKTTVCRSDAP